MPREVYNDLTDKKGRAVHVSLFLRMKKKLFSTSEVAKILGISRVAVFKKIKSGAIKIKTRRVGHNFIIEEGDLPQILGSVLTEYKKREIETAVDKTIHEYGETLKLLGKE